MKLTQQIWTEEFSLSLDNFGRVYYTGKSDKLGLVRVSKRGYSGWLICYDERLTLNKYKCECTLGGEAASLRSQSTQ